MRKQPAQVRGKPTARRQKTTTPGKKRFLRGLPIPKEGDKKSCKTTKRPNAGISPLRGNEKRYLGGRPKRSIYQRSTGELSRHLHMDQERLHGAG